MSTSFHKHFKAIGLLLALLFLISASMGKLNAQDSATLSPQMFMQMVRQFHPIAKQGSLLVENAEAQLLSARGAFDPSIYFTKEQKRFNDKTYYDYTNATLKIPTWFGIELMAGLENNSGSYTDPQLSMDKTSYAGLSIPLAKNLLMDRRRATLAQAKLMVNQGRAEQQLLINDLLYDAIGGYWNWVKEYQVYQILTNAVKLNEDRYQLVKVTVEQGDKAGVDSTEALTQLLSLKVQQNDAYMKYLAAGFELSNYLWTKEEQPYLLPAFVVPEVNPDSVNAYAIPQVPLNDLLATADSLHPKLQSSQYKIDALDIERRLKFQSLLPTLNVKYNALSNGYEMWKGISTASLQNNYKFGLDVGIPLFLRQGRGDYKAAKIKLKSAGLDLNLTRLTIENKIKQYYNEMLNLLQQVRLTEQALAAYQKVYEVEQMKFGMGESSLFLMNSRETKLLEARQKATETRVKFFKSLYALQWTTGSLH